MSPRLALRARAHARRVRRLPFAREPLAQASVLPRSRGRSVRHRASARNASRSTRSFARPAAAFARMRSSSASSFTGLPCSSITSARSARSPYPPSPVTSPRRSRSSRVVVSGKFRPFCSVLTSSENGSSAVANDGEPADHDELDAGRGQPREQLAEAGHRGPRRARRAACNPSAKRDSSSAASLRASGVIARAARSCASSMPGGSASRTRYCHGSSVGSHTGTERSRAWRATSGRAPRA